jgi:hypothetical protein
MSIQNFHYLFLAIIIYSLNAQSSAIIQINEQFKEIKINVHLIFYGDKASTFSKVAIQEIQSAWTAKEFFFPEGSVYPSYRMKINLTSQTVSEMKAQTLAEDNKDYKNNFIRLDQGEVDKESFVLSNGANSGVWYAAQGIGKSKTAAHEFGHILGLGHLNPNIIKDKATVSIMATKMTEVSDKKFQNLTGNTIFGFKDKLNISFRQVTDNDLSQLATLFHEQQLLKKVAVFEFGKIPSFIFDKNGIPR